MIYMQGEIVKYFLNNIYIIINNINNQQMNLFDFGIDPNKAKVTARSNVYTVLCLHTCTLCSPVLSCVIFMWCMCTMVLGKCFISSVVSPVYF